MVSLLEDDPHIPYEALLVLAVARRLCRVAPTDAHLDDLHRAIALVKQFAQGTFTPSLQARLESMMTDYRAQGFLQVG